MIKRSTKSKRTRRAQNNFKKWETAPAGYIPKRGEFFVPVTTKNKTGIGKWYVSNKGTVISFTQTTAKEMVASKEKNGYKKCCGRWLHQLVWFSFRDAVKEQRINSDKIAKRKIEVKQFLTENLDDKDILIHHINGKKTDNKITNLIALPRNINGKNLHGLLHCIQTKGVEETRKQFLDNAKKISDLGIKEPVMFIVDNGIIEPKKLTADDVERFTEQINKIVAAGVREDYRKECCCRFNLKDIDEETLDKLIYLCAKFESREACFECIEDNKPAGLNFTEYIDSLYGMIKKLYNEK